MNSLSKDVILTEGISKTAKQPKRENLHAQKIHINKIIIKRKLIKE